MSRADSQEFGNTTHPLIAQRMIMASLALPATDDEMKLIAKMTDVVAHDDTNSDVYEYNLIAEGFAEYRLGHYKRAVDFLRKATPMDIGPNCAHRSLFHPRHGSKQVKSFGRQQGIFCESGK